MKMGLNLGNDHMNSVNAEQEVVVLQLSRAEGRPNLELDSQHEWT